MQAGGAGAEEGGKAASGTAAAPSGSPADGAFQWQPTQGQPGPSHLAGASGSLETHGSSSDDDCLAFFDASTVQDVSQIKGSSLSRLSCVPGHCEDGCVSGLCWLARSAQSLMEQAHMHLGSAGLYLQIEPTQLSGS